MMSSYLSLAVRLKYVIHEFGVRAPLVGKAKWFTKYSQQLIRYAVSLAPVAFHNAEYHDRPARHSHKLLSFLSLAEIRELHSQDILFLSLPDYEIISLRSINEA